MSGGKFKAWHLIVIVAGIAALAWGAYSLFTSSGPGTNAKWAKDVYGVDVVTGQVYMYNTKKGGAVFPAKSPDTNERTVVPVGKNPDTGEWFFDRRFTDFVRGLGPKAKAVTDLSTRQVKVSGEPKRAR